VLALILKEVLSVSVPNIQSLTETRVVSTGGEIIRK
jgi:hypothetical protein